MKKVTTYIDNTSKLTNNKFTIYVKRNIRYIQKYAMIQ